MFSIAIYFFISDLYACILHLTILQFLFFFFCFVSVFAFLFLSNNRTAVIVTGPILPKPAKPLPIDLEKFMASAGDDGVIIVSFGSMMSSLPIPTIKMLAKVLGEMKQKVLWKLKGKCHVC